MKFIFVQVSDLDQSWRARLYLSEMQRAVSINTCLTTAVPDTVSHKETRLLLTKLDRYFYCRCRVANQVPKGRLALASRIKSTTASPVLLLDYV